MGVSHWPLWTVTTVLRFQPLRTGFRAVGAKDRNSVVELQP